MAALQPQLPTLQDFLNSCKIGQCYEAFTNAGYSDSHVASFLDYEKEEIDNTVSAIKLSTPQANDFRIGLRKLKNLHRK